MLKNHTQTKYSNELIQLAQEMIRAQSDPDNNPPNGLPPIRLDSYYPSRNVAAVIAFIYDYCYDQLSASLKTQMIHQCEQVSRKMLRFVFAPAGVIAGTGRQLVQDAGEIARKVGSDERKGKAGLRAERRPGGEG